MEIKNKKIVAGMMAGFYVLSTQTLVQYGLLVGNGGIATKNLSSLQAFGASDEDKNVFGASDKNAFEETNEVEKKLDVSREENEDKAPNNKYKDGKKRNIKRQGLPTNGHVHILGTHFYISDIKKQKLDGSKDIDGASGKNALKMEDEDDRNTYIPDIKKQKLNGSKDIDGASDKNVVGISDKNVVGISGENVGILNDNCEYSLDYEKKEATLKECINKDINEVTIPEHVVGEDGTKYKVASVDIWAWYGCKKLQSIDVDKDNQCFKSVDGVLFDKDGKKLIKYPEGKEGDTYTMPEDVEIVGDWAFAYCYKLQKITLSKVLKIIGDSAFQSCYNLCIILIPRRVESIGNWAFNGCYELSKVILLGRVKRIGCGTFNYCKKLKMINLNNVVDEIGDLAFRCCRKLKRVDLFPRVRIKGTDVFEDCELLERINIQKGWQGKSSLIEMGLGDTIVEVDNIDVLGKHRYIGILDANSICNGCQYSLYEGIEGKEATLLSCINKDVNEVTIPEYVKAGGKMYRVKTINTRAFEMCKKLKRIILPQGVKKVFSNAFYGCFGLEDIIMPFHLEIINNDTFTLCCNLENIIIPEGAQYKDRLIAMGLSNKIVEGELEYEFEDGFEDEFKVEYAYEGKLNANNICNGFRYILDWDSKTAKLEKCINKDVTEVVIPEYVVKDGQKYKVITIGEEAFQRCHKLIKVTLPRFVDKMEGASFFGCYSLKLINLCGNIPETTSRHLFRGCYSLERVRMLKSAQKDDGELGWLLPEELDDMDDLLKDGVVGTVDGEFTYRLEKGKAIIIQCIQKQVTEVKIPIDVKIFGKYYPIAKIEKMAFEDCKCLNRFIVDEDNQYFKSVDGVLFDKNGNKLIKYPEGKKIDTYTMPEGVECINNGAIPRDVIRCIIIPKGAPYKERLTREYLYAEIVEVEDGACICDGCVYILNNKNKEAKLITCIYKSRYRYVDTIPEYEVRIPKYVQTEDGTKYEVTSVDDIAWKDCEKLQSFYVDEDNQYLKSVDGVLFDKDGKKLIKYPEGKKKVIYKMPEGVKCINNGAIPRDVIGFIIIPKGVPYKEGLEKEGLGGNKMVEVEDGACIHDGCIYSLNDKTKKAELIKCIYNNPYYYKPDPKYEIRIPRYVVGDNGKQYEVTSVDDIAWKDCEKLQSFYVDEDNQYLKSVDGVLFDKDGKKLIKYPEGKKEVIYKMPEGVKCINNGAIPRDVIGFIIIPKGAPYKEGLEKEGLGNKMVEVEDGDYGRDYSVKEIIQYKYKLK